MKLENSNQKSFWYFFNLFQLTFLKFYLNILDSKEATKEQINKSFTLFNYFCFWLSIFPFLWFICKLPSSTSRSTLSTNLPGLGSNSNEISWETFLTSFDYNQQLLNSLNEVEINANSFLLNHEKFNTSIQTLISVEENIGKQYLKELKPRNIDNNTVKTTSFDLDEIPAKLESSFSTFSKNELDKLFVKNTEIVDVLNKSFSKNSLTDQQKQNLNKGKESENQNLKIARSKEKTKLKLFKTAPDVLNINHKFELLEKKKQTRKLQNWENFLTANELFLKYSRNSFFTNISLFTDSEKENLALLKNEKSYLRPRFMTGYSYPDLNSVDVWRLTVSNLFKPQKNSFTVSYYPKSIYFSNNTPTLIGKNQNTFISPIYEIGQSQAENGTFLYLRHDPKMQDLLVKNRFTTQNSFFNEALVNNSETSKPLYFFANLNKTDLEKLLKDPEFSFENLEKQQTSLNHPIIQNISFFSSYDPRVNLDDIKNGYHQTFNDTNSNLIAVSDFRNSGFYFIPHSHENQNIKAFLGNVKNNINSFFTTKETKENEMLLGTGMTQQIQVSKPLIKLDNPHFDYSPNLYKREIGSYWKSKVSQTEEFLTLNDSININSIFSVSLLGFLISTFLILKTAYADYAKEFSSYLLDLISSGKGLTLDPSTIEWLNQELGLEEKKGGIRVFPKRFSKKRFTDIAGIKKLLPELSELVWFLRNKGRKFNITPLTSKSVLLVGPPGTGKTLLVQALAAEAEVPVVAQSTSVLASMNQDLTPGDAIRMAFQKARSLAPCILFLDELDSLGLRRDSLLTNNSQQVINFSTDEIKAVPFFEKTTLNSLDLGTEESSAVDTKGDYLTNQLRINITNEFNSRKQQEREQVAALTQLLIEIDGVQSNSGILVIGATNRSNILDPALIRPGRFSKVIALPLPDKAKRIEIFKLHSTQLGCDNSINWDYLAQRTKGFSAGDLSTVVNQSAIQAILQNSKHNLQTFESAITVLTTYPVEKNKVSSEKLDPYYSQREVYYRVAQTFYNYYANIDGKAAFVELNSRQPNPRYYQILANVNNDKNQLRTRFELENLLTSLLAGKVGELLMLLTFDEKTNLYWESDLAKNDFYEATKLVVMMMQDWYLYTTFFQQQKFLTIPNDQNAFEYRKNEEVFSLFEETVSFLEQQLTTQFQFSLTQSIVQKAQWKADIIQEISNIDSLFAEWSRFHLPDPQETDRNPEWIPPEEYYHDNQTKKIFSSSLPAESREVNNDNLVETLSFSELLLIERDRYTQSILLSSFNKAFLVLEKNREVLDILACFLYKNQILRSFELEDLITKKIKY